jgi:hypothetical protein
LNIQGKSVVGTIADQRSAINHLQGNFDQEFATLQPIVETIGPTVEKAIACWSQKLSADIEKVLASKISSIMERQSQTLSSEISEIKGDINMIYSTNLETQRHILAHRSDDSFNHLNNEDIGQVIVDPALVYLPSEHPASDESPNCLSLGSLSQKQSDPIVVSNPIGQSEYDIETTPNSMNTGSSIPNVHDPSQFCCSK